MPSGLPAPVTSATRPSSRSVAGSRRRGGVGRLARVGTASSVGRRSARRRSGPSGRRRPGCASTPAARPIGSPERLPLRRARVGCHGGDPACRDVPGQRQRPATAGRAQPDVGAPDRRADGHAGWLVAALPIAGTGRMRQIRDELPAAARQLAATRRWPRAQRARRTADPPVGRTRARPSPVQPGQLPDASHGGLPRRTRRTATAGVARLRLRRGYGVPGGTPQPTNGLAIAVDGRARWPGIAGLRPARRSSARSSATWRAGRSASAARTATAWRWPASSSAGSSPALGRSASWRCVIVIFVVDRQQRRRRPTTSDAPDRRRSAGSGGVKRRRAGHAGGPALGRR